MATPFELSLERELSVEWQRFVNKWLFPWHNINIEGKVVDLEDFRGGRFHTGGIVFQGQIQDLYWQAIKRYLAQKIDETFQSWDVATQSYPEPIRTSSLNGVEVLLRQFVARIINKATETDRALRGRGFPQSVELYNSSGAHSGANAQIQRLADSHRKLMELSRPKLPDKPPGYLKMLEKWYGENKALVWIIGIVIAIAGIVVRLVI